MNKQITIVIPYLNEPDNEVYKTIKSIYDTANPTLFDIIVIDDCSKKEYIADLKDFPSIRHIRNKERIGSGACKQMGGDLCETENMVILDSHMRFYPQSNWLNKMIYSCQKEKDTIFCSTSLGLGYGNMDIRKYQGKYYGADLLVFDKNADPKRESRECLEPKWRAKEDKGEIYEIPIILGAVYFMTKKRFDLIHGFKGLKMWGSEEVFISVKNFMCGGTSKIHTGIEVGHKYRDNSPFSTNIYFLYYNKIYICKTIFSNELENKIVGCLPQNNNLKMAIDLINKNKDEIESEKKYYQGVFTKNIYDFCKVFNVDIP